MNGLATNCPPEELLARFGLGKLDGAGVETIHEHLETCAECRRLVAGLPGDAFLERLREVHAESLSAASSRPHARPERKATLDESVSDAADRHETPPDAARRRAAAPSPAGRAIPPELANHPDYELLKELGRGGMGVVYLARNRMMDRLEVLKVVNQSLLDRPGALERFQQEIRSAARLSHPNIVMAYAVLHVGELLVFAMEHVDGQDLSATVKRRGPLPVANAAFYAHQVALGLQHAHDKGMVHRDIKPNNLMLAVEGKKHVVKILDFGLAKATSEKSVDAGLTKSGQMLGTPDYIAPEQTLNAQKADIRADIYSLGCTLYFMLSGRAPFSGQSLYATLQAHHTVEATRLNLIRPEAPGEIATVVAKMMAKEPAKRYQTPSEVARALVPFFKPGPQGHSLAAVSAPSGAPHEAPAAGVAVPAAASDIAPLAASAPAEAPPEAQPEAPPVLSQAPSEMAVGIEPTKSKPKAVESAPRWSKALADSRLRRARLPIALGLALVGGIVAPAVIFKFKTAEGIVTITTDAPNPKIFVDGNLATVSWNGGGTRAEIRVRPGERKIELKKDGFKAIGETVSLESGGREELNAHFEPLAAAGGAAPSEKPEAPRTPSVAPPPIQDDPSHAAAIVLRGHENIIWGVAFSPDAARVVSGSKDGAVKLWDAATGRELKELSPRTNGVRGVAWSPDGRLIAAVNGDTVLLWDANSTTLVRRLTAESGRGRLVAFSPDSQTLAATNDDKRVDLWDVSPASFHADAKVDRPKFSFRRHAHLVSALAFSPDGKQVASGEWDERRVKVWDAATGDEIASFEGLPCGTYGVAFSPDGKLLASCDRDAVRIWNLEQRKLERVISGPGIAGRVWSVPFSPDGRLLACASDYQSVVLVDPHTGELLAEMPGRSHGFLSAAFSPDGRRLIAGTGDTGGKPDATVHLWDVPPQFLPPKTAPDEDGLLTLTLPNRGTFQDWQYPKRPGGFQFENGIVQLNGPDNFLISVRRDYKHTKITVELSASPGTRAFVGVRMKESDAGFKGITSLVYDDGASIRAGMSWINKEADEHGMKRTRTAYDEVLKMTLDMKNLDLWISVDGETTSGVSYGGRLEHHEGAIGFFVEKGSLKIRNIDVVELP